MADELMLSKQHALLCADMIQQLTSCSHTPIKC